MRNDQTGASGSGGWPQVQWAQVPETAGEPTAQPENPAQPAENAQPSADELVLPDGYIYDAEGYAHPVYGGYVYDDEGTAHPVESLVSGTIEPPTRPLEEAPPAARTADSFTFDRFTSVDPQRWGFGDGAGPTSRSAARQAQKRRRRRLVLPVAAALAVLVGLGVAITTWVLPSEEPEAVVTPPVDDFPGPGSGTVEVVVNPGDGAAEIGQMLTDAGVVKSVTAFTRAVGAAPAAGQIDHGTYTLREAMSAEEALEWLLDPQSKVELKVTIPENITVEQVLRVASAKTQIPLEEFEAAAESPRRLGVPRDARKQLEGWLHPGEYTVLPGDSAEDVLAAMVAQTRRVLNRLDVPQEQWEATLTQASLVEQVIPRPRDYARAARVIQTRLEKGMPLQIDSTLAYGLGKSPAELTVDELMSDHRYNTRVRTGLPPTPISSPSRGALVAVIEPEEGPWEYWVTVNPVSGRTLFSESYAEFLAHTEMLDEWIEQNGTTEEDNDDAQRDGAQGSSSRGSGSQQDGDE